MNRRGFLSLLGRAAAVTWVAPFLPDVLSTDPPITVVRPVCAISLVKHFTVTEQIAGVRFDVLYGFRAINPALACRIAADYIEPAVEALYSKMDKDIAEYFDAGRYLDALPAPTGLSLHTSGWSARVDPPLRVGDRVTFSGE